MRTFLTVLCALTLAAACGCMDLDRDIGQKDGPCSTMGMCREGLVCDQETDTCIVEVWTDPTTGLTWQTLTTSNETSWANALDYCRNLSLADLQDWRLPTISELRTLVRGCAKTMTGGLCSATDECLSTACNSGFTGAWYTGDCYCADGSFEDCAWPPQFSRDQCGQFFWSSSSVSDDATEAWVVSFAANFNYVIHIPKVYTKSGISEAFVLCVR